MATVHKKGLTTYPVSRRLGVVGSRGFADYALLKGVLDELPFTITQIISGGATGADAGAFNYAHERNINIRELLPDWETHGKAAGPIRNRDIIDNCDFLVAFWDGKSKGTKHSLNFAMEKKIRILIVPFMPDDKPAIEKNPLYKRHTESD